MDLKEINMYVFLSRFKK